MKITIHRTLLSLFALTLPALGQQDPMPAEPAEPPAAATGAVAAEEALARPELTIPPTPSAALEQSDDLEDELAGRDAGELEPLLTAWLDLADEQAAALDEALAAPEGSPQRARVDDLRADLDRLLAGADAIAGAVTRAGGDAEDARARIEGLRPDEDELLEATTVPASRQLALDLPIEVLKAQLRPLTRAQIEAQLDEWLGFLQRASLEVRNVEVSALRAEDPSKVEEYSARGVELRGERSALIRRVEAVISALERKGGDVEDARAYVESVTDKPTVTGLRAAWATVTAWLADVDGGLALLKSVVLALGILVAFWFLSKALRNVAHRATHRLPRASELLREFITTMVQRVTMLIGALIALSTLGVNMTPLVAAIGAAGLVVGLALQGTLSNLASGLLIMIYRPFDVDDVVQVASVSGKVVGMTLMTTTVRTFDNQTIHVPNNKIWGDVITNVTANATRRVDLVFGIGYGDDFEAAKETLMRTVKAHDKVLDDPAPVIRVHQLGDSSVDLIVRPWVKTEDYWEVLWDLTEAVKRTFDEEGISIPFPQRDVHLIPVKGDEPGDSGEESVPSARGAQLEY